MPVSIVDRLPLPNLKAYTAGSVALLAAAVYYAMNVTGDPEWRLNATLQRKEAMEAEANQGEAPRLIQPLIAPLDLPVNASRNVNERLVEVLSFMMQEPLCMWIMINVSYCLLAVIGLAIQRLVFGRLRVAEAQRLKDRFWNYVFYKFIFVFGVLNVQYVDEVLLWCTWFTLIGFLQLFGQLCKDRYEYLWSSPRSSQWSHARLALLVGAVICGALGLLAVAARWALPAGKDVFAFMAAECVVVVISALHVAARYLLQLHEADEVGPLSYYTHLIFDCVCLVVEAGDAVHMVVHSRLVVSVSSLVLLMRLRHLLHELHARLRRHRLYTALATHMSRNYPMASKEEVEKNQDHCAICWEPMKEARKLPCSHLFHNSCLCQWMQQDASCPTCRRALADARPAPRPAVVDVLPPPPPPALQLPLPPTNRLFRFDASRYVSWLPSFSVEVTRVRGDLPPGAAPLEAIARQVQTMFPQYPLSTLVADLLTTLSPDLTIENILEGRLLPPSPPPPPPSPPPRALAATSTQVTESRESSPGAGGARRRFTTTEAATTTTDHEHDYLHEELDEPSTGFSKSSSERETMLQRRKEMLIANARRKYLDRLAGREATNAGSAGRAEGEAGNSSRDS